MDWLLVPAGVLLILVGFLDVFFTVLHYDGFGFLSSRLYERLFGAVRLATRPLPRRHRAMGLSMAAPLMVPATITVWMFLVSLGYALIYLFGMRGGDFSLSVGRLEPSFMESLYFSGITISTLGLGDVTPTSGIYQALAVSEALIGFGILTLSITYVLGVYNVLQHLGVVSAGLYHQAQDTSDPWSILAPHFPEGQHRGLETHLMSLHRGLVEIYEGIRQYPIVYYYHSRRAYRSLPFVFRMVGGMAGALRFGLPEDHPASQTPWLPTLLTGLDTITDYLEERFLSETPGEPPDPVPFETFEAALLRGKEPADYWLGRFLQMNAFMRDLVRLEGSPDPEEAYGRYERWLPFAHHNRAFFETAARDLGYGLDELEGGPGEKLF
ncbi:MAG: two pore domain potassium channel family protein [Rubrobacter sp.]|nr:two pore domain potassium channel family protein [Rubrobacter sp.]